MWRQGDKDEKSTDWIHRNNEHYIGNAHFAVRVPFVTDSLRKALATYSIYEPNKRASYQSGRINLTDASGLNIERIMFPVKNQNQQLIKTPLSHEYGKDQFRVFMSQDGANIFANNLYICEIEKIHAGTWCSDGGVHSPIYLYASESKPVAVLMPTDIHEREYGVVRI